jgi:hypothetical protein
MEGRSTGDPRDWFPIEVVLTAILIRIQEGNATDLDRWFCRSVFDRISRRGYGMEPRPLMRDILSRTPYQVSRWVEAIKGRYIIDSDIDLAYKLLETESETREQYP